MNTATTIFQNEISITELSKLFKVAVEDVANVLNYPSCISFGAIKK